MIKHIVMWTVEGENKEEVISQIKEKLEAMPETISEIKQLEVGVNFKESPAAFDVVLTTAFKTKEDLETYVAHPHHQDVAKFIGSVVSNRAVVDYEV